MKSVSLAQAGNHDLTTSLSLFLCELRRYGERATDPRDIALTLIELEDLLQTGLRALETLRERALELSA